MAVPGALSDSTTLVVFLFLGLAIGAVVALVMSRYISNQRQEGAGKTAEKIVRDARKDADTIRKEAEVQAKSSLLQAKIDIEKEVKERQKELQVLEKRLQSKEDSMEKKAEFLDRKEMDLEEREKKSRQHEEALKSQAEELTRKIKETSRQLEKIAGITQEQAKKILIERIETEAKIEAARTVKQIEETARETADKEAKKIITLAIQRYAGDYVADRTVSVVNLPSDEMKGRIIGREGRNIRALEAATGMDLIIDDTPETVVISGFNPVRREVARMALERLITDGRIHPARIEEVVAKAEVELEESIREAGEQACFDVGVHGVHPELVKLVGRLKYRTSYAQNIFQHSMEVAFIAGVMAAETGYDVTLARRAGLLHDVGKAVDHEVEGTHARIGGDLCKKYGEKDLVLSAVTGHHDDKPTTMLAVLIQAADALSAARPGARREMLESYVKRLEDLEKIAAGFDGIDKCFAIQAGREIRIIVENEKVDDEYAYVLSKEIARKIESELSYPGQIKVTVIRETRAVEFAK